MPLKTILKLPPDNVTPPPQFNLFERGGGDGDESQKKITIKKFQKHISTELLGKKKSLQTCGKKIY